MRVECLGEGAGPGSVLRALRLIAAQAGSAPPAALIGDWFGSRAVLAPSLLALPGAQLPDFGPAARSGAQAAAAPAVGGGWIGALAYPDRAGADGLPAVAGGFAEQVLRLDQEGLWWFESLDDKPCPNRLREAVREGGSAGPFACSWTPPDQGAHEQSVRACLAAIAEGEIYQACVTTNFTGELQGDPMDFFLAVAEASRPAKAAYVAGDWGAVASFSPELYLRRQGTSVVESPIKGTLPRQLDPALLRSSAKDIAENVMIVDLVRHDLGQLARTGSVRVVELLDVREAPGVWHLVSSVAAEIDPHVSDRELVAATFPPASVTGTPKLRARELLSAWEPEGRGMYCGAVGMSSPEQGLELNVAIRTVSITPAGTMRLGVGGGVTADSEPEQEWQECLDKASSILDHSSNGARASLTFLA
ncbi:para-aminobenzoate synthase, subunit I [Segniliparus rotundus DSM 44985]|uniref:Para-aminobenzoate synthase, subunit I n=1 Tax=Segniliparus rotundus (strain ATCC BAA-972 / CDC 1076 / CIP 108378 / DSM 44985 / JCM 13578) TaxID=640132 RepID=D6ZA24_SEGRD|nr:aminodeoxychorismate synthase component I [Segniliparus rotundus]ADG98694.1 para-aminobenzoate synthase, subunit I [Segniliparus rotundus DSM 44985]